MYQGDHVLNRDQQGFLWGDDDVVETGAEK